MTCTWKSPAVAALTVSAASGKPWPVPKNSSVRHRHATGRITLDRFGSTAQRIVLAGSGDVFELGALFVDVFRNRGGHVHLLFGRSDI
jgi:hypothetical protein